MLADSIMTPLACCLLSVSWCQWPAVIWQSRGASAMLLADRIVEPVPCCLVQARVACSLLLALFCASSKVLVMSWRRMQHAYSQCLGAGLRSGLCHADASCLPVG